MMTQPQTQTWNTKAAMSLTFGILGVIAWELAPVALVLGFAAMGELHKHGERGATLAAVGAVLGAVVTLAAVLTLAL